MDSRMHFVGFATLEALLATHDPASPLYMVDVIESLPSGSPGVFSRCTYIVVSDFQGGVGRYWRYRIGYSTEVSGQLLDPAGAIRLRVRAERAVALLRCAISRKFNLSTQAGIVSYPKDLAMVLGDTGLLMSDSGGELQMNVA